jgi:hypothetical protein
MPYAGFEPAIQCTSDEAPRGHYDRRLFQLWKKNCEEF